MPMWAITAVAVATIAAAALVFTLRRRRDAVVLLGTTVAAWVTTYAIGLPTRPAVACGIYGTIGTLVVRRSRRLYARIAGATLALGAPLAVTWWEVEQRSESFSASAGSLAIGVGFLAAWSYLMTVLRPVQAAWHRPSTRKIIAIVNPSKFGDGGAALRRELSQQTAALGLPEPQWLETTLDDPGSGMVRAAVAAGADLVIACGGDGTVRACADGLAGTRIPLGVVPSGTGNLLARNLGMPLDYADAVKVALTGAERVIDLGRVDGKRFAVMAGIGFDAALVAGASERLKTQVGWPAYFLSGVRHLFGDVMRFTISLDDGPELHRRARGVLIGNVGRIQGGIPILPDAVPDDGLLDVVILAPRGLVDWTRVGVRVLARRRGTSRRMERFTAKKVCVRTERPHPRELDGEIIDDGTAFEAEIEPAALIVRVPPAMR